MNGLRVLVVAAAVAILVGVPSASGAPTGHFVFQLLNFKPTGYVDAAPRKGIEHPTPGDTLTATSTLYDKTGKHRVGRTSELCVVTVASPMTMDCTLGLMFVNGSELLVHGAFDPSRTPWRAAIVGGYGQYAGARGWVRETSLSAGERMTGVLLP
jgi:hypothetical protein